MAELSCVDAINLEESEGIWRSGNDSTLSQFVPFDGCSYSCGMYNEYAPFLIVTKYDRFSIMCVLFVSTSGVST